MTVLICHETLQHHLVKVSCDFVEMSSRYNGFGLSRNPTRPREEDLMVSYHPAKFSDHWHCGSGNMFLVVEEEYSTWSRVNLPLLFVSQAHGMPCSHTQNFRTQILLFASLPLKNFR